MKLVCALFVALALPLHAADLHLAADATNLLGVDLYHQLSHGDENLCISPYSIETALEMTFEGADGDTRLEMARVLHLTNPLRFAGTESAIPASFRFLQDSLSEMAEKTARIAEQSKKQSGPSEPITLSIANRLFAQSDYDFRESFQSLVREFYGAPFETLDFKKNPETARTHINKWVAEQTREKIRDLIPPRGITALTRLVLANAIYLKAPWNWEFNDALTTPKPFHVRGGAPVELPVMKQQKHFGYAQRDGFTAVTLPYAGEELQFLILLPDEVNGLAKLESTLDAKVLNDCAKLDATRDVDLEMPKFRFEPPTVELSDQFKALGMKTAFDEPPGSANFDRIASRKAGYYLAISKIFHKTFIAIDEKGTEAAAATAVVMKLRGAMIKKEQPIEVKVDRPFIYAIQHVPSGACLFIGRVTDPR